MGYGSENSPKLAELIDGHIPHYYPHYKAPNICLIQLGAANR